MAKAPVEVPPAPAPERPAPPQAPSFRMPEVSLGEDVYWYPRGDRTLTPFAAKVAKVGHLTVCLLLFDPNSHSMQIRESRHVDDPDLKKDEAYDMGGWDYSELGGGLRAMIRELQPRKG